MASSTNAGGGYIVNDEQWVPWKLHQKKKTKRHICDLCDEAFDDQFTFFQHLKTHYENPISNNTASKTTLGSDCQKSSSVSTATVINDNKLKGHRKPERKLNGKRSSKTDSLKISAESNPTRNETNSTHEAATGVLDITVSSAGKDDRKSTNADAHHYTSSKNNCSCRSSNTRAGEKSVCIDYSGCSCAKKTENTDFAKHFQTNVKDPTPLQIFDEGDSWDSPDEFDDDKETERMYLESNICPFCDEVCESKEHLEKHIAGKHSEVFGVNVQNENAKKKGAQDVSDELETEANSVKCNLCPRVFRHKNSLVYHLRSHTGERPYECTECGKRFFATSALIVHSRLHSGEKPFECDICHKTFRQGSDLKYHQTSIHSNVRSFQCEFCGKDFARKYSLTIHRRIHTGERNYTCDICNKGFRAASYLLNHKRIHTGEKRHTCPICKKAFRMLSDMKRHVTIHSKQMKVATVIGAVAGLPPDFNSENGTAEIISVIGQDGEAESQLDLPVITAVTSASNTSILPSTINVSDPSAINFMECNSDDFIVPESVSIGQNQQSSAANFNSILPTITASPELLTSGLANLGGSSTESLTLYQGTGPILDLMENSVSPGGTSTQVVLLPLNSNYSSSN